MFTNCIVIMSKIHMIIFIILFIFLAYNLCTVEKYENLPPPKYDPSIGSIYQIHWIGRFGNRMFQYTFGCHYAHKYDCYYQMPSYWEGTHLFKPFPKAFPIFDAIKPSAITIFINYIICFKILVLESIGYLISVPWSLITSS